MYILEGISPHYVFNAMNINIQPQSKQIQNLAASDYHLCGKISLDSADSKAFSTAKRTVLLQDKGKVEKRVTTDESDSFCFEVKQGTHVVIP